jgi:hypothetical protein
MLAPGQLVARIVDSKKDYQVALTAFEVSVIDLMLKVLDNAAFFETENAAQSMQGALTLLEVNPSAWRPLVTKWQEVRHQMLDDTQLPAE